MLAPTMDNKKTNLTHPHLAQFELLKLVTNPRQEAPEK